MQSRTRILPSPFPNSLKIAEKKIAELYQPLLIKQALWSKPLTVLSFLPHNTLFTQEKGVCKTHSQLEESQGSNPGLWIPELSPLLCVASAFEAGKKWRSEGLLAKKAGSSTRGQCLSDSSSLSLP